MVVVGERCNRRFQNIINYIILYLILILRAITSPSRLVGQNNSIHSWRPRSGAGTEYFSGRGAPRGWGTRFDPVTPDNFSGFALETLIFCHAVLRNRELGLGGVPRPRFDRQCPEKYLLML